MSVIPLESEYVSEEDYLAMEERAEVRHEYLAGMVYAMSGASTDHNRINGELAYMLIHRLRGGPCEPFFHDMKVRFQLGTDSYYYYPDAVICCDQTDIKNGIREHPTVVFEITSESTRSIDEREKRAAYHQIPSLQAYVRIEQDKPEVLLETRTSEGWRPQRISGLQGILRLECVGLELPLAELYQRVTFDTAPAPAP